MHAGNIINIIVIKMLQLVIPIGPDTIVKVCLLLHIPDEKHSKHLIFLITGYLRCRLSHVSRIPIMQTADITPTILCTHIYMFTA